MNVSEESQVRVYTVEFYLNLGEKQQNKLIMTEVRIMVTLGVRELCGVLDIVCILIQRVVIHTCIYTYVSIYVIYVYI